MELRRRMFANSVSSRTVILSPEANQPLEGGMGIGITQVTIQTQEATANADMWGTTGSCGRFEVIIRKVS